MDLSRILRASAGFAAARLLGRRRPLAVGWDVTHRCNRRCRYCGFPDLDPAELSTADALSLIDELAAAGAVRVHLSGGEPMMRPDIGQLLERLARHRVASAVNTNGYQVPRRVAELRRAGLIRLSYDGPQEVHDAQRGAGAHREMLLALEAARRAGLRVVLNATLGRHNVGRVPEMLDDAAAWGVRIKFQPVFEALAYGRDVKGMEPDRRPFRQAMGLLKQRKRRSRLIINSVPNLDYYLAYPDVARMPCVAGILYTRVNPLGRLYPCSMKRTPELMRDSRRPGFQRAFANLPPVNCSDCICPPTLELNLLYNLSWRSLRNIGQYL